MNEKREVFFALRCNEKGSLEGDVLSTQALTNELNSNKLRTSEWNPFDLGPFMAELDFELSITPLTLRRGWPVSEEKLDVVSESVARV
jgi:hypothetical protein